MDSFTELQELVSTLRSSCPWDREQTHSSLGRHLIEEAYETLEALEAISRQEPAPGDDIVDHLREELGDLLVQVFFHAKIEEEKGRFTITDVADNLCNKLIARHPHVFGDATATNPEQVAQLWEKIKTDTEGRGMFDGIPKDLPALSLVAKLQRKANSTNTCPVEYPAQLLDLERRLNDLKTSLQQETLQEPNGESAGGYSLESSLIGEMLLSLARIASSLGIDAEAALRESASQFRDGIAANISNDQTANASSPGLSHGEDVRSILTS